MKITRCQLRKIIKEALTQGATDKEIASAVLPHVKTQGWHQAAEILLSIMSYQDLQLYLDDSTLRDELQTAGITYDEMRKIEDAAWPIENARMEAAIASDPDKAWLKFLGMHWTSEIEPDDMQDIKWKQYKKYIRLKPPRSISHGVGEINISKEDHFEYSNTPGTYKEFIEFLENRAGGQLGRRKPYRRSPPPIYD